MQDWKDHLAIAVSLATLSGVLWKYFTSILETQAKVDRIDAKFDPEAIARLMFQVETLWRFLERGALSESVVKGMAKMNSPVVFSEEVLELYRPIASELVEFFRSIDHPLQDWELMCLVQARFGEWIVKNISIPNSLQSGACVMACVAAMKKFHAESEGEKSTEAANYVPMLCAKRAEDSAASAEQSAHDAAASAASAAESLSELKGNP